jgi:hypothetical protein
MSDESRVAHEPERSSGTSSSNIHIGALIFGAASTILVALRLLSVARFNPETAYGILQASGTTTVLIGTVISLIPSIAIIAASCLVLRQIFRGIRESSPAREDNPALEFTIWGSIFILALIALLTTPLRYAIAGAIVVAFLLVVWIFRKQIDRGRNGPVGGVMAIASACLVALLLMFGVVLSPPWMPAERLSFNNARQVTGYILAQTSSGVTVMQIKSREILYYGPNALTGQSMCSDVPANDFSIMAFPPFTQVFGFYRYVHC